MVSETTSEFKVHLYYNSIFEYLCLQNKSIWGKNNSIHNSLNGKVRETNKQNPDGADLLWREGKAGDHSASLTRDLSCDLPVASSGTPPAALLWHRGWLAIYLLVNWAGRQRCFFSFSHISRIEGIFPTYFSHKDAEYSPPTVNKSNLAVFMPPGFPSTKSRQYRGRCVKWEIFQTSVLFCCYSI